MNHAKPLLDWSEKELIEAARERGLTDHLLNALADKIVELRKRLDDETAFRMSAENAYEMRGARGRQRRLSSRD